MATIIVNLKTYREGTGKNAEKLARQISSKGVYIAVQNADIFRLRKVGNIIAQHVDGADFGANTGKDTAYCIKENGAVGALINHAEDPCPDIKSAVGKCKEAGLLSVVCVPDEALAERAAKIGPDYIALEIPELIGKKSILTRPDFIENAVQKIRKANKKVKILCGAGISKKEDFRAALDLGCDGILLSSAVVKSGNPGKKMAEFFSVM